MGKQADVARRKSDDSTTREIQFPREMGEEDALFWNIESEPILRSTTAAVTLLDGAPDRALLRARMQQAVVDIPRLRQHVVELPSFLSRPVWVRDPYFDLDYHLRWVGAPSGGKLASVFELAAAQAMASFDRTRPLWEFTVVEGLEGGRAAVIQKLHHAVTDGVGGMLLMDRVYDRQLDRPPAAPNALLLPDESEPGRAGLIAEAVRRRVRERPEQLRTRASRWLGFAREPFGSIRRAVSDGIHLAPALAPVMEPMSSIAIGRSSRYRYHAFSVELETLRRAGRNHGCTINDAFIAGVTGGWRRYHDAHGVSVAELRATVPVSLRSGGAESVSGNQLTTARVELPVEEPDAGRRMVETRARLRREFARPNQYVMQGIAAVGNRMPELLRRSMVSVFCRGVDFVPSCITGFSVPLYMAGARVRDFYMFGPTAGTALNVSLFSYEGRASIALNMDPAAIPDGELLLQCMVEGFDEVLELAGAANSAREFARTAALRGQ